MALRSARTLKTLREKAIADVDCDTDTDAETELQALYASGGRRGRLCVVLQKKVTCDILIVTK